MCGLVTGAMFRREVAKTVARGLSAWRSASNAAVTTGSLAQEACLAPLATSARGFSALTAEDKAGYDTIVAAIKKDPKSVYNKYRGRYVIQFSLSLSRSLARTPARVSSVQFRPPPPPPPPSRRARCTRRLTRRRLFFPLAVVILRDWWAQCENKAEIFDSEDAQAMMEEYFDSLSAVCVSEEARREVRKHRTQMLGMVDEYRQLFKEIGKNPYLKPNWEVDWDKMRKDYPGAIAKQEVDFFESMDKKLTPLLEEQRKDFVANQEKILFNQPEYVAYKKKITEEVAPGLVQLKADYDKEIAKCEEKIAKIEEELDALDYITIEECLDNNPELAAEIDAEIERQEW